MHHKCFKSKYQYLLSEISRTPSLTKTAMKSQNVNLWLLVESLQSCPTLYYPTDCSPADSSSMGILHSRILEWVVVPSSRGNG